MGEAKGTREAPTKWIIGRYEDRWIITWTARFHSDLK
jgi:hypothetical protein